MRKCTAKVGHEKKATAIFAESFSFYRCQNFYKKSENFTISMCRRILSLYTLLSIFIVNVNAAPSDHGKIFHASSFSIFVGQIILVVIFIMGVYLLLKRLFSKSNNHNLSFPSQNKDSQIPNSDTQKSCPYCKGRLFIDLGPLSPSREELKDIPSDEVEIYWGSDSNKDYPVECARRVCPYCKGKGVL